MTQNRDPHPASAPSRSYDRLIAGLSAWLVAGLFLDGWAHVHIASLETFFTPWHAVFYSGYVVLGGTLAFTALRGRRAGHPWRTVMPAGYGASLVGAAVFAAGGLLDLLWHTLFGIERGIDALLSPTHLILATGLILIVCGPLRSLWRSTPTRVALSDLLPAVLSLTYVLSVLAFFTQFAEPVAHSYADKTVALGQELGVASILLQSGVLAGVLGMAVRRWDLPFGTLAIMFALSDASRSLLAESSPLLTVGLLGALTGALADGLVRRLRPRASVRRFRLLMFVVPLLVYATYFAALESTKGITWSVHLALGSIAIAGISGLLVSYVIVPPGPVTALGTVAADPNRPS